jgi:DnaJ-class molecular chaperone
VLGVSRSAAQAEIKKTFRKLAQENHPDKIKGATKEKEAAGKRMADINRAHDILSNEQKKKQYDETGGVRTERAR